MPNFYQFHVADATVGYLSNTHIFLLVNKIYATKNKHVRDLCSSVPGYPKEIIHMFVA